MYSANRPKYSVWTAKVSDFKWKEQSVINRAVDDNNSMFGNISTAEDSIVLPPNIFREFTSALKKQYPIFSVDGEMIHATQPCSRFNLGNITLTVNGLDYRIP